MPIPNLVSNLKGAIPTQYDPAWQLYTDLSPAQIAAFQAFPQDLTRYIGLQRWQKEIAGITLPANIGDISGIQLMTDAVSQQKIAALKQAIDNGTVADQGNGFPFLAVNGVFMLSASDISNLYGYVVRYVQATYSTAATLLSEANATPQTLTTRAPVDSAFAAIIVQ